MSLDRGLALVGILLGLPAFLAVFFTPHVTAAALSGTLAVGLVVASVWVKRQQSLPPFSMASVSVQLDFPAHAQDGILTKEYGIVANINGARHLTHRNIAADGAVSDFTWDGRPIPAHQIKKALGEYEVTVLFDPAPTRGNRFSGNLKYRLLDSFSTSNESLSYVVDFPTERVDIKIKLPPGRPCLSATARKIFGGQELPMPEIVKSSDGLTISVSAKKPRVGAELVVYWVWP